MSNRLIAKKAEHVTRTTAELRYTLDGSTFFRLTVVRAGSSNPAFTKLAEELTRATRQAGIKLHEVEHDKQREITRELYAKTVVVDWNEADFGTPYSVEAMIETFKADEDLLDFVVEEAQRAALFRSKAIADLSGN